MALATQYGDLSCEIIGTGVDAVLKVKG
jgi:hypothetical protein